MAKLLDPVCGMTVDDTALRAPGHDDVAFCAPGCRTAFLKDPKAFSPRLDDEGPAGMQCGCHHDGHDAGHSASEVKIVHGR